MIRRSVSFTTIKSTVLQILCTPSCAEERCHTELVVEGDVTCREASCKRGMNPAVGFQHAPAASQIGFLGPAFFLTQLKNVHGVYGAVACMMASQGLDAFSQSGLYSNHQVIAAKKQTMLPHFPLDMCLLPSSSLM